MSSYVNSVISDRSSVISTTRYRYRDRNRNLLYRLKPNALDCLRSQENEHDPLRSENGSALIAVLGVLLLINLLAASAVTVSQLCDHFTRVSADRALSSYYAEGVGARMIWFVLNDKKKNGNPNLKSINYAEIEGERYLPDGTKKTFTVYQADAEVSINDMLTGIDVSGKNPTKELKRTDDSFQDDEAGMDEYLAFLDGLEDYVDPDDFVRMHGAEKNEYEELELPHLPRNDQLQFREEIMMIPGAQTFYKQDDYGRMNAFQVIPTKKLKSPTGTGGKTSFFGVGKSQLRKDGFTNEQADKILEVRAEWQNNKEITLAQSLVESLEPEVIAKINQKYSFVGSGFYNFLIKVKPRGGLGSRVLSFSLQLGFKPSDKERVQYYEWLLL